ncbi:MAG: hypothetical protein ACI837_002222 [Crocinitomicaceae bacterium]|jgi:hypothetical protein
MSKPIKMRNRIILGAQLVLSLFVFNISQGCAQVEPVPVVNLEPPENIESSSVKPSPEYKIEKKVVSREEYNSFITELEQIEGTYHCAKTMEGGMNSYEATDVNGIIWVCHGVVTKDENKSWANKK